MPPAPVAIQPAPSPGASTPGSSCASTPATIAPRIKHERASDDSPAAAAAAAAHAAVAHSATPISCIRPSKEWVLPPRPKPGRKPSTETPPTKRKAQNRAAQRAFRERRAARVVELEDRLHELETEKERKETDLTSTLMRISEENMQLKSVTDELRQQIELFRQFQAQQAAMAAAGGGAGMFGGLSPAAVAQAGTLPGQQGKAHMAQANHLASPAPSPGSDAMYSQDMLDRALEERLPVGTSAGSSSAAPAGSTYRYQPTQPVRAVPLHKSSKQSPGSRTGSVTSPYSAATTPSSSATISVASDHHTPQATALQHAYSNHTHMHSSPLPPQQQQQQQQEMSYDDPHAADSDSEKCGICERDGGCLCSDIGIKPATDLFPAKRSYETPSAPSPRQFQQSSQNSLRSFKRVKTEPAPRMLDDDLVMDFTHAFTSTKIKLPDRAQLVQQQQTPQESYQYDAFSSEFTSSNTNGGSDKSTKRVTDPCGFCSSGTPCLCAEAAEAAEDNGTQHQHGGSAYDDDDEMMNNTTLPPLRGDPHSALIRGQSHNKLTTLHPEPISDLVMSAQALVAPSQANGGAQAQSFAPGTCEQCQRDPMQTLFCTSLAASKGSSGGGCGNCNKPGGCCGGAGAAASSTDGMFIPCSAAYQTLSRHKGFKAVELPSLVGKLSTKGGQVEVASVAGVLRELDRRLYN
ncbi:uncharacterized protein V1518DRAFT_422819 [Limtongia smithiae]|uniref:uncharacterized protein n=1 Tax=Limtongia smithiae TaxID=1125753 RepID=UPI0034CE0C5B